MKTMLLLSTLAALVAATPCLQRLELLAGVQLPTILCRTGRAFA
jgi:hypothetical protein